MLLNLAWVQIILLSLFRVEDHLFLVHCLIEFTQLKEYFLMISFSFSLLKALSHFSILHLLVVKLFQLQFLFYTLHSSLFLLSLELQTIVKSHCVPNRNFISSSLSHSWALANQGSYNSICRQHWLSSCNRYNRRHLLSERFVSKLRWIQVLIYWEVSICNLLHNFFLVLHLLAALFNLEESILFRSF